MINISSAREFWRSLEPRAQLTLVVSLLAVAVTMFMLYHYASQPSYSTVQSGLDPAATGRVTQALDSAGVKYKIENGGTAVAVLSGQESKARIALGGAGVTPGGHVGWELFDKSSLSTTDFQQQVNYQRALEGSIASTIEGIDGVTAAQVQLVLPKDQLFQDQSSQATAAVLLTTPGGMDSSTVRGIAHMVSSSVQGLDPQNVTITDETGTMLWPAADSGGVGSASKLQQEQAYGAQVSSQVDAMLTQILGAGKAEARVHANLNVDQTTQDSVTYDPTKVVPLQQTTNTEKLDSNGATSGGVSGTAGNLPPGYTGGSSGGKSTYTHDQSSVQNGVDKVVSHTNVAPGAVEKLDVALVVDSSVKEADVTAVKNAVSSMVGIDPSRGDTLTVSTMKFAKQPTASSSGGALGPLGNPISLAKTAALVVALGIFLFLVRKNLKRREGDPVAPEPRWLRDIEQATPVAQLAGRAMAPNMMTDRRQVVQGQVEQIVKQQPDQVALQVTQWMNE